MDQPFDPSGPAAGDGLFGLGSSLDEAGVVIVAAPWEATTSYGRGTARAPEAIVRASWQVELFDLATGHPYRSGIAVAEVADELVLHAAEASACAMRVIDALAEGAALDAALEGDRARVNELSCWLNGHLEQQVAHWASRGKLVGLLGGDHSTAYGSIAAQAKRHPGLGVLQLDAHADLRPSYQGFTDSHASVMHRVVSTLDGVAKLVSVGVRDLCAEECDAIASSEDRIVAFYDLEIARRLAGGEPYRAVADAIVAALPDEVYLSFDIDGLDPSLCPHTGTPVPGGLSFHQVTLLLEALVDSGRRIVGFDLVEVAPGPADDEWDANVGARLLYKMIGYGLRSRGTAGAS
jgi:agmatinase